MVCEVHGNGFSVFFMLCVCMGMCHSVQRLGDHSRIQFPSFCWMGSQDGTPVRGVSVCPSGELNWLVRLRLARGGSSRG